MKRRKWQVGGEPQSSGDYDIFNQLADYAIGQDQQSSDTQDSTPDQPDESQPAPADDNDYQALQDRYSELEQRLNLLESNTGNKMNYEGDDQFLNFLFADDPNDKMPMDFSNNQSYSDTGLYKPQTYNGPLDQSISARESGGNYQSESRTSSAVGKYQFLWKKHRNDIKAVTGVSSKEDFKNSPDAQEKYYKYWEQNTLLPTAQKLLPYAQQRNPNTTIEEVARQVHFSGPAGAAKYYKYGIQTRDANGTSSSTYQNGGDISQMGYRTDSPYQFAPYLDIHTPTGEIDMTHTNIPLLGVSNQGEQQLMQPGGKYKFGGNMVREHKLC